MTRIPKNVFLRRKENASKRMAENIIKGSKKGLTERQANILDRLCSVRHDLHTNSNSVILGTDSGNDIKKNLLDVFIDLKENGLGAPDVPYEIISDNDGYIDVDSMDELYDFVGNEGEEYDKEFSRIAKEVSDINYKIEDYLGNIDEKYGTSYKPTGKFRGF